MDLRTKSIDGHMQESGKDISQAPCLDPLKIPHSHAGIGLSSPNRRSPIAHGLNKNNPNLNDRLKDLLSMPLTPFTPAAGTYRCSICWETSDNRADFVMPCRCKNDNLKYVCFYFFYILANFLGPQKMHK